MNLHERMHNALNGIEDPTKRAIAFLSEFGSMLQERGAKLPIVVGGAALEIYTSGQYSSHDIDIKSHLSITMDILGQMGFENEGRSLMYSEEFDILLDWQGSSLEEGPEAEERILKIRAVKDKAPLNLISIEDLIIDRLEAYTYGNDREALGWAHALFLVGKEGNFPMHREIIEKLAVRADVGSALEKMLTIGENDDDESPRP